MTFHICTSCLRIQEGILPERIVQLRGQAGIQTGTGEIIDVSEFLAIFRFTPRATQWFFACLSLPQLLSHLFYWSPPLPAMLQRPCVCWQPRSLKLLTWSSLWASHITPAALCQLFLWIELCHGQATDGASIKVLLDCVQGLPPPGSYWTLMNWSISCMYKTRSI